jgi:hypothetical protein
LSSDGILDLDSDCSFRNFQYVDAPQLRVNERLAMEPSGAREAPLRGFPISRPRSEKPDEHRDVLSVVEPTSRSRFVSEPITLTKKDLGFWIGMALWIGPPLFPLLVSIVWAIRDVPWQGRTATIADHAAAEAPAVERASSNGIGPVGERHRNLSVLFGAPAKLGVHSSQP